MPVNLQSRLFYGNIVYTGVVTNVSENGMFISTKMSYPIDSVFIAVILLDEHTLQLPIKIRRTVRSGDHSNRPEDNGVGVRLLDPSREYIDFVSKTRASL